MITIRKNPNFSNWLQVFSSGKLVNEFTRKAEAVDLAESLARNHKQKYISPQGQVVKVKKLSNPTSRIGQKIVKFFS